MTTISSMSTRAVPNLDGVTVTDANSAQILATAPTFLASAGRVADNLDGVVDTRRSVLAKLEQSGDTSGANRERASIAALQEFTSVVRRALDSVAKVQAHERQETERFIDELLRRKRERVTPTAATDTASSPLVAHIYRQSRTTT